MHQGAPVAGAGWAVRLAAARRQPRLLHQMQHMRQEGVTLLKGMLRRLASMASTSVPWTCGRSVARVHGRRFGKKAQM